MATRRPTSHLAGYISLSNEISINDLAEGFDSALRVQAGLSNDEEFDAIVHSTGSLVLREWLATYDARRERVKHPGGRRDPGALRARARQQLHLGPRAPRPARHRADLRREIRRPYPFVFIGTEATGACAASSRTRTAATGPSGGRRRASPPAADRRHARAPDIAERVRIVPWSNVDVPLVFVECVNHASIVAKPPGALIEKVTDALAVEDHAGYEAHDWQQLVLHTVDERGDPVPDYFAMIGTVDDGAFVPLEDFAFDVHPYTDDTSYRCFYLDLTRLDPAGRRTLELRVIARSETELIGSYGHASETLTSGGDERDEPGRWEARIDLTPWLHDEQVSSSGRSPPPSSRSALFGSRCPRRASSEVLKFVLPDP